MAANATFDENAVFGFTKQSVSTDLPREAEGFDEITHTKLLEDKRRSRTKSTGRPPSQTFMKECLFHSSFSIDDNEIGSDEAITSPTVTSSKFTQIVQEVSAHHASRTVVDGNKTSTTKVIPSPLTEFQSPDRKGVPWMKELLERKKRLSLRGDEFMKIAEQNQTTFSFKHNRNDFNPETSKKITTDEFNAVNRTEEIVTFKDGDEIKKTSRMAKVVLLPVHSFHKIEEKVPEELVSKNALKGVLKDVDSFLVSAREFEEDMLKKIRELEKTVQRHTEEEIRAIEILKKDLTRLVEDS